METPTPPVTLPEQGDGKQVSDELFSSVIQQLTGGKTPEQMQAEIKAGKWPFAVSEEQMRADIASWSGTDTHATKLTNQKKDS